MGPLKLAVTLFFLLETSAKRIPTYAGPYRAIIHRIGNDTKDFNSTGKAWVQLHTTQVRGKQLQYGWGHAFVSDPFTDDMKVLIMMSSWSNNEWKKNAFIFKFDRVCTNARIFGQSLLDLFYGKDYVMKCPIEPFGLREIKNSTFEIKFPHFPVMPYGRYLFNLVVTLRAETMCIFVADIDIVPRL